MSDLKTFLVFDTNHCLTTPGIEPTSPVAIVKAPTETEAQAATVLAIKLKQLVNSEYKFLEISHILTLMTPVSQPQGDTLYVQD